MNIIKHKDIPEIREQMLKNQGNRCLLCNEVPDRPCLDHSHDDGNLRGVLCHTCNAAEGRIKNIMKRMGVKEPIQFLRNLAQYLQQDYSGNAFHPEHIKTLLRAFKRLKKEEQLDLIQDKDFKEKPTKEDLLKQYKKEIRNGTKSC